MRFGKDSVGNCCALFEGKYTRNKDNMIIYDINNTSMIIPDQPIAVH
jgi:hypothetical protein